MSVNRIFNLENDNSCSSFQPSEELLRKVQKINKISNIKDKLQFYNDNICSLSNDFYNGEIYEFGSTEYYWKGLGNLLFKAVPNEDIYETYLEIRANEIKRLQCLIAGQSKTIEKLKILFEKRAGQVFFNNEACKIYTNDFITFLRNGAGITPNDLREYDIDLSYLRTGEDIKEYNRYLYNFYFKIFKKEAVQPIINRYEYNGFNFEVAIKEFEIQLTNSLDFHKTLNNEIKRIELFFPLNDFNNIIYSYYDSSKSFQWQCALFNGFSNGLKYDFSRAKLEPQQIKDIIHIEQIFLYYKELLNFRKNGIVAVLQSNTEPLPLQPIIKQQTELKETLLSEKHQKSTPSLKEFISENLNKALSLNLSNYPAINDVLQRQKDKLRDAEFESEFLEVKEFAEKGIIEIKNRLQSHLRRHPDNPYKNDIDSYLWDIRLYHEYNEIYNKTLPLQPISRTKKVIFEIIANMDKQGWQYAFGSEQNYIFFTDLLVNFFEYKPYTLPETVIQLKRTCKTKVAKALGEIHKELSNENKLSTDTKYFELIRVLSPFEKETEGDLYKALTR